MMGYLIVKMVSGMDYLIVCAVSLIGLFDSFNCECERIFGSVNCNHDRNIRWW
jgi:hypothetical protein